MKFSNWPAEMLPDAFSVKGFELSENLNSSFIDLNE